MQVGLEPAVEDLSDLRPVPVDRRDQDVAGAVVPELANQLRKVGLDRLDSRLRQSFVQVDLVRRDALDLDNLLRLMPGCDVGDDRAGFGRVARPVNMTARRGDGRFKG